MKYVALKNGFTPSMLGYGCMRFPEKNGEIDEEMASKLLATAYENGINYYDLGHMYHHGKCEEFVGRVMSQFDRKTFYFAAKIPMWSCETFEDAKKLINKQLTNLRTDYIDFYLVHAVDKQVYEKAKRLGVINYLFELKKKGVFLNVGFSFHDTYDVFEDVIRDAPWDFCQLQLNYMDMENQAGIRGLKLSESLGIPVFVMEPVKGGALASLPSEIEKIMKDAAPENSIASWALRFIASFENVKVVLSGMSDMAQLTDNIKTFSDFKPLDEKEMEIIKTVQDMIRKRVKVSCTSCRYCMPCPAGVNIPGNFGIWNVYGMYENKAASKRSGRFGLKESEKAANCVKCGKCEEVCPQKIPIREMLEKLQIEMDSI